MGSHAVGRARVGLAVGGGRAEALGEITAEHIVAARAARGAFKQVVDALAPEPPGRTRSRMAKMKVSKPSPQ